MDADHADEQCPTHGQTVTCPSMCPIYDLPVDDDRRQRYEALAAELDIEPLCAVVLNRLLATGGRSFWVDARDHIQTRTLLRPHRTLAISTV